MATRTQRTQSASILQAQRHRAEHDAYMRRLNDVDRELQRLNTAVSERNTEITRAQSDFLSGIIRVEVERLEGQIAERGAERQDILQQIADFRRRMDSLEGRVGTLESGHLTLRGEVDGLQANSNAHATAISEIQDRLNGPWYYVPIAGVVFFFAAWLMLEAFVSLPLWRDLVISGAIGCIAAALVAGIGFSSRTTRVAASASSGATVAPQPPANQPVAVAVPAQPVLQADAVIPPPPPPSGNQFPAVHAAAAANASAGS